MHTNSFLKVILAVLSVIFFASCDKDYNSIGGNLLGDEHFGLEQKFYNILSYNQKIGSIQSNNLPINPLGIYKDAVFGTSEASFVTQLSLASGSLIVGANPEIDNVVLSIPYFSHVVSTNATSGSKTYALDSIYGNPEGKIKLSVYESGYFMRDLDPSTGFLETQKYYTNQGSEFENLIVSSKLNNKVDTPSQNDAFFFDKSEIETTTKDEAGVETTTKSEPAMRLALDAAYFQTKFFGAAASGKFVSNDVFKNYFRGLYFKVEKNDSSDGCLAMMNFRGGTITINYKEDYITSTSTTRVSRSIVLNLTGNTVSLFSNTDTPAYATATDPSNIDKVNGDEKLYLRGGQGSMAILELFDKTDHLGYDENGNLTGPNGVSDELDELRRPSGKKRLLINEASLVFHVDKTTMGEATLPRRIYLYDLTNSAPIVDYLYDATTGVNPANGFLVYSGLLNKPTSDDNNYKVRITNHIINLIKNTNSANVKLGVVVTENISNNAMNKLRTAVKLSDGATLLDAPQISIMSPVGVVLHGGKSSVSDDKRLKLEIYYTKPN